MMLSKLPSFEESFGDLNEELDSNCWTRIIRKVPFLGKIINALYVVQLFMTNVLVVAFDVGSDLYTAIAFHR